MTAQELRIGNYIASGSNKRDEETWVIGKVVSICSLQAEFEQIEVETEEEFDWFFKDNYFGIPITDNWLKRFGFQDQDWIISHKETYFNLFREGDNYFFTADQHHHNSEPITYVHQLQNLYFALTGQELKLNK